ncbi:MAG: S41 family peptidase [Hyphomicrobiaceae bacterium]
MQSIVGFPGKRCVTRRVGLSGALAVALLLVIGLGAAPGSLAQESQRTEHELDRASSRDELGRLFDAVVDAIKKSFWDKERLAGLNWLERMRGERAGVAASPDLPEAARRINLLLDELDTSHTVLLTPDDVDYYVLRGVFGRSRPYAGIGVFTARIDGRDFIDLLLEGYPADRAGLKVGDEIVGVDGGPYHPIRSFRGKGGGDAAVAIRRSAGGPITSVDVDVVNIVPLKAFSDATLASARVIEQDGRRIGYVHVWASVGDVPLAVSQSLERLGLNRSSDHKKAPTVPAVDALIFDMRGKIGGMVGVATQYLELLDPRGPDIAWRGTSRESPTSVRGRTAVLIDHHTRSTGEVFVHSYKRERQGPLIGTTTAGAVSGGAAFNMPADCLLHLAVSGLVVDGEILEARGVAPDITVQRPLAYSGGADPVLDAAIAELVKRPKRQAPGQPDPKGNSQ